VVAGGPVSWETKRQNTVALSTVEAEFMAFSWAITQALWLLKYQCTKHIDVHHYFVKECAEANEVIFKYIPSVLNMVDFLTKPLPRDAIWKIIAALDLGPQPLDAAVQEEC